MVTREFVLICLFETTDCHRYCTEPNVSLWGRKKLIRKRMVRVVTEKRAPSVWDGQPVGPPISLPVSLHLVPGKKHLSGEALQVISQGLGPNSRVCWFLVKSLSKPFWGFIESLPYCLKSGVITRWVLVFS